jgi:hypothetical protein
MTPDYDAFQAGLELAIAAGLCALAVLVVLAAIRRILSV